MAAHSLVSSAAMAHCYLSVVGHYRVGRALSPFTFAPHVSEAHVAPHVRATMPPDLAADCLSVHCNVAGLKPALHCNTLPHACTMIRILQANKSDQ